MYEHFYGLKEKPFQILADPAYLFMSKSHETAYTHLEYGILENKGFVVISGEIGSGKTTLINYMLEKIEENIQIALIHNTLVQPGQLVRMLCDEFEIEISGLDETQILTAFYQFLVEQYTLGRRVTLIIDEAQNLSVSALEEVRMLSNFELDKQHLFQVIFVGQPELRYKLQQKALAQLAQRVTVHYHLNGLSPDEVESYIHYRLQIAGAEKNRIFEDDAIEAISVHSRGIPRLINILCDTALVYGYADGLERIDRGIIETIIQDREVGGFGDLGPVEAGDSLSAEGGDAKSAHRSVSIDQRFDSLEKRLEDLENKLSRVAEQSREREKMILELFKLLHRNFESRSQVLHQVLRPQPKEFDPGEKGKRPHKNITRFRL